MNEADRRRLHDERRLAALMRDPHIAPAVRLALQIGAKVGESRTRRNAFIAGVAVGFLFAGLLVIWLVRLGASEGRQ